MRVRCPKCTSVNVYPDDLGWRRTECPVCSHEFVATRKLAVDIEDPTDDPVDEGEDRPPALRLVDRKSGPDAARIVAVAVAGAALLAAGLLARAWLVARYELRELRMELEDLSDIVEASAGASSAAGSGEGDRLGVLKGKLEADRVLVALQAAVVQELQSKAEETEDRIRLLETKVERGENALDRERDAHGQTKQRFGDLLKENMALRRELDACLREMRDLERRLDRGR